MKDFISWLQTIGHTLKDWFDFMTVKEWIALGIIIAALALAMTGTSATRKVVRRRRKPRVKPQPHADSEQIDHAQQPAQADDDASTQSIGANEEFAVEQGHLTTEDVTRNEPAAAESTELNQQALSVEQGEVPSEDIVHAESLSPTIEEGEAEQVMETLESDDNVALSATPEQIEVDASQPANKEPKRAKIKRRRPISIKVNYKESTVGKTRQRDDIASVTGGGDTVAAQLNLARVYADIGDNKEAKQLLREVLKVGTEEQKQLAQEFMKKLEE